MKAPDIERMSLWKRLVMCTAAYPTVFAVFFMLPMMLKGDVGLNTLDFLSKIVTPAALLTLGFLFARWPGLAAQLLSIVLIPQMFSRQTEEMVSVVGDRGYSYASAQAVPFIFLAGWALTMAIIAGRSMLETSQRRSE